MTDWPIDILPLIDRLAQEKPIAQGLLVGDLLLGWVRGYRTVSRPSHSGPAHGNPLHYMN